MYIVIEGVHILGMVVAESSAGYCVDNLSNYR